MATAMKFAQNLTAIVLAGGQSRRMKTDKCLLPVNGRPMIEHVIEQLRPHFGQVLISADRADRFPGMDVEIVVDNQGDLGPVMGIITALKASAHELSFVHACDIPHTDLGLVREMIRRAPGYDVVVPRSAGGRIEPLFAMYAKSALNALDEVLRLDRGSAHKIVGRCAARFVDLPTQYSLRNLNTPADYQSFVDDSRSRDPNEKGSG